ncbi:hypothetical protein KC19_9G155200 [Ceratodon purpureus]|uniref:Uncharacterized protein n=1 Tax=Ceratodon purpureus TaxID=3225 RepID=A0A8T0GSA1_CERPU|nr:hypothetical protein KC19_9G155200 [Ceratodon purpureus]
MQLAAHEQVIYYCAQSSAFILLSQVRPPALCQCSTLSAFCSVTGHLHLIQLCTQRTVNAQIFTTLDLFGRLESFQGEQQPKGMHLFTTFMIQRYRLFLRD